MTRVTPSDSEGPRGSAWSRSREVILSLCLFLIVLGANWATAWRYGSDIPDMDQWDAEGLHLLAPWHEQGQRLAPLFQPHNEHRVILTKLQNLGVITLGGHWDSRVECLFNAAQHAALALGLWLMARRWVMPAALPVLYAIIAALYALPLAWQNLLGGFHSQQYWLVGLSALGIGVASTARQGSGTWWVGVLAMTLALASMGSGFFAAAVVVSVLLWRWATRQTSFRGIVVTLSLALALVALGVATRVEVDYHEPLKAKTAHDFFLHLVRSLEWPLRDHEWAAALLWAPWTILAVRLFRGGLRRSNAHNQVPEQITVALGGWVLLQLLATAYTRGAGAHHPASRYMDTLIFGAVVNAIALGLLWFRRPELAAHTAPSTARPPLAGLLLSMAWLVALGCGLTSLTRQNLTGDLPATRHYYVHSEHHLRAYLATDNPAELQSPMPYLHAEGLIERLSHASLRERMPSSVRPPLAVTEADSQPAGTFSKNLTSNLHPETGTRHGLSPETPPLAAWPTWGSHPPDAGARATGTWRSAPITTSAGWLRFEVAGDLGEPGVALELRDARTDASLAQIRPSKVPHHSWRTTHVQAPRVPFVIVATDESTERWLAFSSPVEMTSLSYWSWRVMKHGLLLSLLAGAVALGVGVLGCMRSRGHVAPNRSLAPRRIEAGRTPRA